MRFPLPESILKPDKVSEEHLEFVENSKKAIVEFNKDLAFGYTPSNHISVGRVYKIGKYKSWQKFYILLYECLHIGLIKDLRKNLIYPNQFNYFSFEIGEPIELEQTKITLF